MFSNDSCLNITVMILLVLLAYVVYRNYYSNEGFAEKHHGHHAQHGHQKHKAHHATHTATVEKEEKPKTAETVQQPVASPDLNVNGNVILPNDVLLNGSTNGWLNIRSHDNSKFNNLSAGYIVSNNGIHSNGNIPMILGDDKNNQFVMHTPQDGRKQLWITPRKDDNSDWDWSSSLSIDHKNHIISTNSNQLQLPNDYIPRGDADGWMRLVGSDGKYKRFASQQVWADNGVLSQGCDFVLGQNCGRGDSGPSRALVKDQGPQLVINYANDFKAGTRVDGDLHVNKLWIGDRWSLEPEGNVLVFRDNKTGGDNRYAMFPGQGNGKNL